MTAAKIHDAYTGKQTWAVLNADGETIESGFSTKRAALKWIDKASA